MVGLNSENPELHEGMIRFDIIFYVRMRDGVSQDLTVNEKLDIIGTEYAIPMEKDFREDVNPKFFSLRYLELINYLC